jgi:hypothetical protein
MIMIRRFILITIFNRGCPHRRGSRLAAGDVDIVSNGMDMT